MSHHYHYYELDGTYINSSNVWDCNNFTGIIKNNNIKHYHKNGKLHREDGPAIIWPNNRQEYYVCGELVEEEQHKLYIGMMKLKGLL